MGKVRPTLTLCGLAALGLGIAAGPAPAQQVYRPPTPLGLDEYFWAPEDNPPTAETITLGRRLFFDSLLSLDRTVACASCHRPALAFADSVPFSQGVGGQTAPRHTPSLLNRAYGASLFWDGRATTLEDAVLQPIRHPREMNLSLDELLSRLRSDAGYRAAFSATFADGVTDRNVARALASYVRVLRSGNAPLDRYIFGDATALTPEARAGMRLFNGRANCVTCHVGPNLTDEKLHNTGVSWGAGDLGRFQITRQESDRGAFKTPTLRNVALTAPYMHDGSIPTLERVVKFYAEGGNPNPHLDEEIRPLTLNADEERFLVAFLHALTGELPQPD